MKLFEVEILTQIAGKVPIYCFELGYFYLLFIEFQSKKKRILRTIKRNNDIYIDAAKN